MPRPLLPIALLTLAATLLATAAPPPATPTPPDLDTLATQALSPDPALSTPAIAQLRAAAYPGLDALLAKAPPADAPPALTRRWHKALDQVAQQKDAHASHLFWYTDLPTALAEAQRTGKPLLSLRMLGKLSDDLSCANSRFFRTTLYANTSINAYLRTHFILQWQSVRPVPVITIDMGDGRSFTRTITGNSIHYLLDSRGRLIDALPGLYGAKTFLRTLQHAEAAARTTAKLDDNAFPTLEAAYAQTSLDTLRNDWQNDLAAVGAALPPPDAATAKRATAIDANRRSLTKGAVETPILAQLYPTLDVLNSATTDSLWQKIAARHADEATLDSAARTLIASKLPPAEKAMPIAATKRLVESPMLAMMRNLESSIALDTVKNEYTLHTTLLQWLQHSPPITATALAPFNDRVYADLFLTPSTDPWLGLAPKDTFSALDNEGLCEK